MQVLDHNLEEILVDNNGYKQFFDELEKLKLKSLSIASSGSESYKDAVGDGWHDNFDFEESMRESRTIASRIERMLLEQNRLKIISKENLDKNFVIIDDIIEIEIIYNENDIDNEIIKLTGKYIPDRDGEITLNSPLGRSIYKKSVGSINEYKVNDKIIKVQIVQKCNL